MRDDAGVELQIELGELDTGVSQMGDEQRCEFLAKAADR